MKEDNQILIKLLEESGDPGNPDPERLRDIVRRTMTIAVVGLSRDPLKPARRVPSYLAAKGATVIPVNPNAERILGRPSAATLDEVSEPVDLVLLFRPSDQVAPFVRSAAARPEDPVIWMQEGIRDDTVAQEMRAQGHEVIQNLCIYKVHRALGDTRRRAEGRIYGGLDRGMASPTSPA